MPYKSRHDQNKITVPDISDKKLIDTDQIYICVLCRVWFF